MGTGGGSGVATAVGAGVGGGAVGVVSAVGAGVASDVGVVGCGVGGGLGGVLLASGLIGVGEADTGVAVGVRAGGEGVASVPAGVGCDGVGAEVASDVAVVDCGVGVGLGETLLASGLIGVGSGVVRVSPPQATTKDATSRTAVNRIKIQLRALNRITNLSTAHHAGRIYSSIPSSSRNAARFATPCRMTSRVRCP